MEVFELTEAVPEETAKLEALVKQELGYTALDSTRFSERIAEMLRHPDYHVFAVRDESGIVGFAGTVTGIAFELEMPFMRIIALAVRRDRQHSGIGTALLSFIKTYVRTCGLGYLAVNSGSERADAHRFYEKNGFVKKTCGFLCAV